jgi:type IV pilus assembly protein PilO
MKKKVSPKAVPFLIGGALLLVALIGWLGVVGPQRSQAAKLKKEIDDTQSQVLVLTAQQNQKQTPAQEIVKVADLFRLTKAVPDQVRMPDILLELSKVAGEAGISFDSIAPGSAVARAGYSVIPISVVFEGNYYQLSDLLYRLRNLVEVHNENLVTTGRLFTVDHVAFQQGKGGFPSLQATLTVDAFVYTGLPDPNATTTSSTDTTSTETTTDAGGGTS